MSNRYERRLDVRRLENPIAFSDESLGGLVRDMDFLNPEILRCESGHTVWWFSTRPIYVLQSQPPYTAGFLLQGLCYRDM